MSQEITNCAIELCAFVKTHEYPIEYSEEFKELTYLFDGLETALRASGVIPRGAWPKGSKIPETPAPQQEKPCDS